MRMNIDTHPGAHGVSSYRIQHLPPVNSTQVLILDTSTRFGAMAMAHLFPSCQDVAQQFVELGTFAADFNLRRWMYPGTRWTTLLRKTGRMIAWCN